MRIFIFILLAHSILALLSGCAFVPENGDTKFYGLIIGIEDYTYANDLSYCVDDASALRDSLIAHGWQDSELKSLTNGEATKERILSEIDSIVSSANEKDYVFIYYSGHGTVVLDNNGDEADGYDEAVAPVDTNFKDPPLNTVIIESTLILDDELREHFRGAKTEKGLFIFDSCNSGGIINKGLEASGSRTRSLANKGLNGSGTNGDLDILNFPVLAASGQDEFSWEEPALGHGVFTYFILDGLTHMKADDNEDGRVSVRELFRYAEIHTESYADFLRRSQHPQLRFSRDFVDILVTR